MNIVAARSRRGSWQGVGVDMCMTCQVRARALVGVLGLELDPNDRLALELPQARRSVMYARATWDRRLSLFARAYEIKRYANGKVETEPVPQYVVVTPNILDDDVSRFLDTCMKGARMGATHLLIA